MLPKSLISQYYLHSMSNVCEGMMFITQTDCLAPGQGIWSLRQNKMVLYTKRHMALALGDTSFSMI